MSLQEQAVLLAALQWHLDMGADEVLEDSAPGHTALKTISTAGKGLGEGDKKLSLNPLISPAPGPSGHTLSGMERGQLAGTSELRAEAIKLAAAASTLEDLKTAIAAFDGIAIKKTATNLVFADGNPKARIMLVGEAPGGDEDRMGKPFAGTSGQLLDLMLACIGLNRHEDSDLTKTVYISNILNWRPPGNRTPSSAEIEVSLPFIEKHIALIQPKILIFCGAVSAQALLASGDGISKLRKSWRTYKTLTPGLGTEFSIPCIATYHPAHLLRTPSQKRAAWEDMLSVEAKLKEI